MNDHHNFESKDEIDKIASNLLKASKALGKFPTPIDDIIQCANLKVDQKVDLSKVDSKFWTDKLSLLKRALHKVLGVAIPRKRIIYLDFSLLPGRQHFIKLHETGHHVLPWQASLYEASEDDNVTIDISVKDLYEKEANYFASSMLFQQSRFSEEAKSLPLSISSAIALGQQFGSSHHAAIRRYVEYSHKRCSLLVLDLPKNQDNYACKIRNHFVSEPFKQSFGDKVWSGACGIEYEFVRDFVSRKSNHADGILMPFEGSFYPQTFKYHYFTNSYNIFVLILPIGEEIRSRAVFQIKNLKNMQKTV
jgi:hypothetical protein